MSEVKIIINKRTAEVKVEGVGYTGLTCEKDLKDIINIIGASVSHEELKEEAKIAQKLNVSNR